MGNMFLILAAIAIGACLSMQAPINAVMARTLGSSLLAAVVSIAISLIFVIIVWMTWGRGVGELTQIKGLPWWIVLGGIVGALFVAGSVILAPALGVALFFVCVVTGQLLGATLIDQFGAFGLQVKPVSMLKLAGLGLVLAGAVMVQNSST